MLDWLSMKAFLASLILVLGLTAQGLQSFNFEGLGTSSLNLKSPKHSLKWMGIKPSDIFAQTKLQSQLKSGFSPSPIFNLEVYLSKILASLKTDHLRKAFFRPLFILLCSYLL